MILMKCAQVLILFLEDAKSSDVRADEQVQGPSSMQLRHLSFEMNNVAAFA